VALIGTINLIRRRFAQAARRSYRPTSDTPTTSPPFPPAEGDVARANPWLTRAGSGLRRSETSLEQSREEILGDSPDKGEEKLYPFLYPVPAPLGVVWLCWAFQ
jgi:hypothetical protein